MTKEELNDILTVVCSDDYELGLLWLAIEKYIANRNDEFIAALESYNNLLCDEIDELAGMASAHGWVSKRVNSGIHYRDIINKLKGT